MIGTSRRRLLSLSLAMCVGVPSAVVAHGPPPEGTVVEREPAVLYLAVDVGSRESQKGLPAFVDGRYVGTVSDGTFLRSEVVPGRHLVWLKHRHGATVVDADYFEFEAGKEYALAAIGSFELRSLTDSQRGVLLGRLDEATTSDEEREKWSQEASSLYERCNLPIIAGEAFVQGLAAENEAVEALRHGDREMSAAGSRRASDVFATAGRYYDELRKRKRRQVWARISLVVIGAAAATYAAQVSAQSTGYGSATYVLPGPGTVGTHGDQLEQLVDYCDRAVARNRARAVCLATNQQCTEGTNRDGRPEDRTQ